MLQNIKEFYRYRLTELNGEIGHVKDFYFDDITWGIRYLVADTGSWLRGRQVLITPHAFGPVDTAEKTFPISLTRKQIEGSPLIEEHKPVSRQYEVDYYQYYGWPVYWNGGARRDLVGTAPSTDRAETQVPHQRDDKHLQSTKAVAGYEIHATDGNVGSLRGFMVDPKTWAIRQLVVKAGHWYSGREILIPTKAVKCIGYLESMISVNLTNGAIEQTKEHEVVRSEPEGACRKAPQRTLARAPNIDSPCLQ